MMKQYIFNNNELYVIDNIDRLKCKMLNYKYNNTFDKCKFKECYKQSLSNFKFMKTIE
jgi:hypothetical protein